MMLEALVAEHSNDLDALVILSYALLQVGRDLEAGERVLHRILELVPQHAEASNNLAVLQRRRAEGG